jgi:hypothetical protein
VAARELANNDSSLRMQFSPRAIESDGNCFNRAASLGLYGTEDHHHYLRVRTAFELMRNQSFNSTARIIHTTYGSCIK